MIPLKLNDTQTKIVFNVSFIHHLYISPIDLPIVVVNYLSDQIASDFSRKFFFAGFHMRKATQVVKLLNCSHCSCKEKLIVVVAS